MAEMACELPWFYAKIQLNIKSTPSAVARVTRGLFVLLQSPPLHCTFAVLLAECSAEEVGSSGPLKSCGKACVERRT